MGPGLLLSYQNFSAYEWSYIFVSLRSWWSCWCASTAARVWDGEVTSSTSNSRFILLQQQALATFLSEQLLESSKLELCFICFASQRKLR